MTKQNLSFSPFLYHILAPNMKTVCISGETAEYFHYFSLIFLKICSGSFYPMEIFLLIKDTRHRHVRIFPCDIKSTLENLNAYGYEIPRNRAEISSGTVTGITATVQKKTHNRIG